MKQPASSTPYGILFILGILFMAIGIASGGGLTIAGIVCFVIGLGGMAADRGRGDRRP